LAHGHKGSKTAKNLDPSSVTFSPQIEVNRKKQVEAKNINFLELSPASKNSPFTKHSKSTKFSSGFL